MISFRFARLGTNLMGLRAPPRSFRWRRPATSSWRSSPRWDMLGSSPGLIAP